MLAWLLTPVCCHRRRPRYAWKSQAQRLPTQADVGLWIEGFFGKPPACAWHVGQITHWRRTSATTCVVEVDFAGSGLSTVPLKRADFTCADGERVFHLLGRARPSDVGPFPVASSA